MDDDAPVLLGKLDVKLNHFSVSNNNNNSNLIQHQQSESFSYQPPIAIFPQLVTLIPSSSSSSKSNAATTTTSNNKNQKSATSSSNNNVILTSSSSSFITEGILNREKSSWDVTALSSFREGNTDAAAVASGSGSGNTKAIKSAREALAALVASGKLPGASTNSSSNTSSPTAIIPSTMDIVKALDKFASEIGAGGKNEEIGAALRSQHFLHLLGFQRLEQLRGNLQALQGNNNNNQQQQGTHQPFGMFFLKEEEQETDKEKNAQSWIAERSKLYDSVLNLISASSSTENKNKKAFWAVPPPKSSIEIQTEKEQELLSEGVINWSHPSNDKNSVKSIKADEKLKCRLFLTTNGNEASCCGWSVLVSTKNVNDTTTAVTNSESIKIPLRSNRVRFGRALSSGTIRERMNDDINNNNQNNDDEEESNNNFIHQNDPFHIDLSSIVRKLTNRVDHGLYISREHFILSCDNSSSSTTTMSLLPCSRNFIRVNGAVCYAAPVHGLKDGDVITIGSGNTSPAGVVILIKLMKE